MVVTHWSTILPCQILSFPPKFSSLIIQKRQAGFVFVFGWPALSSTKVCFGQKAKERKIHLGNYGIAYTMHGVE